MARGNISRLIGANGKSRYRLRVELAPDPSTGRRRWRSETHTTRKAAEARLADLLATPAERAAKTALAEYLRESWLPHYERTYRASSYRARESQARRWLVPSLGSVALGDLSTGGIERALAAMRSGGASAGVVRDVLACLSAALNQAVRWGMLSTNPATNIRLPTQHRPRRDIWTPAQAGRFLATAEGVHGMLWRLVARTGMRPGEAMALRWSDIDWEGPVIRVERTIIRTRQGDRLGPPKSAAGRREVLIGPLLLEELRAWRAQQSRDRWAGSDGYVCAREDGRWLPSTTVNSRWNAAVRDAGLPPARLHDLRHLATTVQLAAGVPLKTVSGRLGHSTVAITADLYGHLLREHQGQAAAALDGAFTRDEAPVVELRVSKIEQEQ